ncbi:MAG: Cu(I)-responsive transcriptional regulator [Alphaproteobacteria bacterium]|nr:Cu(I)-responsive transcriptional regulator [Alphaproteobacteria bacterium]MCA0449257.1 Cu(I)-responsive transcriptional regulator [Pseudomonadota bacterium]
MNIGQAAEKAGISAKSIRYYESVGLIAQATRRGNNYRDYGDQEIAELRFIHRARSLGFSVKEVGDLLALWRDRKRASQQVREVAKRHIDDIERKIAELQSMRATLNTLVAKCHGDDRPDCPILEDLASGKPHCG